MEDLKKEINKINERNNRVELDKKWETSVIRKIFICLLTYSIVLLYSYIIKNNANIFLSSLVPVIGFFLSTISLKFIRKLWERKAKK